MGSQRDELVDVLVRLRALQSIPWRCLCSLESKGLAALATLVGAGLMGAMMFLRSLPHWIGSAKSNELTVPGLQNSGNNCFLNAILQALASSQKFAAYLRAYEHEETTEARLPSMPLSFALCELLQELGEVAPGHRIVSPRQVMRVFGHYARSFDLAMQQDAAEALSHLASALHQERMEDFEEFRPSWQSLADISTLSSQPQSVVHDHGNFEGQIALDYWQQQLRWPMEGTYGSMIVCSQCGFQGSMQFHAFREMSLPLPQYVNGFMRKNSLIEDSLEQFTMLERVSNFKCSRCAHLAAACLLSRKPEGNKDVLKTLQTCDYDDACKCEALVRERGELWIQLEGDAFKYLRIGRCPEVLCLHLQRVVVTESGHLEKLLNHVSFSTELDLFPFTISSQQAQEKRPSVATGHSLKLLSGALSGRVGSTESMQTDTDRACLDGAIEGMEVEESQVDQKGVKRQWYDLISVVVHHGSPMSGHYTVYRKVKVPLREVRMLDVVRSASTSPDITPTKSVEEIAATVEDDKELIQEPETIWFAISDADVVKVSEEEVLEATATLLFYENRGAYPSS